MAAALVTSAEPWADTRDTADYLVLQVRMTAVVVTHSNRLHRFGVVTALSHVLPDADCSVADADFAEAATRADAADSLRHLVTQAMVDSDAAKVASDIPWAAHAAVEALVDSVGSADAEPAVDFSARSLVTSTEAVLALVATGVAIAAAALVDSHFSAACWPSANLVTHVAASSAVL